MNRRSFLKSLTASSLVVAVAGCSSIPPIPARPTPDMESALGWLSYRDGGYSLILPRAEMGQGIDVALCQITCAELGIEMEALNVQYHASLGSPQSKATVGSDSVKDFGVHLAQAAAALRDAIARGAHVGQIDPTPRPFEHLRAFQPNALVGKSVVGAHHTELVEGRLAFSADVRVPGLVYGRVLRARAPAGAEATIASYDLAAAQALPGYIGVFEDERLNTRDSVGLGIVGQSTDSLDQIESALSVVWDVPSDNAHTATMEWIDVDREYPDFPALDESGAINLRIDVAAAPHSPIEPRCAVAQVKDAQIEVWTGSQDIFYVRDHIARYSDHDEDEILVHSMRLGGGFGSRTICTVEWETVVLATLSNRPVQVQWTRAQELACSFHRPPLSYRARAQITDGVLSDWSQRYVSSHILFTGAVLPNWLQSIITSVAGDKGVSRGATPEYQIEAYDSDHTVRRFSAHTGPWRGLGAGPNGLALESVLDEVCLQQGIDPLAFRIAAAKDKRLAEVVRRVGDLANWETRGPESVSGRRVGYGVAAGIYKEMSYAAAIAKVSVGDAGDVRVEHVWCAHDCGRVINPDRITAQCEGNIVWSIGMVLMETLERESGAVSSTDFFSSPIPRMSDVPEIEVDVVASDAPPTGAGETMIVAAPGAIANAIRQATGVRPTAFPISPGSLRLA